MKNLKKFFEIKAPVIPLPGERWTELKLNTYRKYLISTKGRIYSSFSGRCLRFKVTGGEYGFEYTPPDGNNGLTYVRRDEIRKVNMNRRVTITVGRLVAETFIKKPKGKNRIIHENYERFNNDVTNIIWVTEREAMLHKLARSFKLTAEQVLEIKDLLEKKMKGKSDLKISDIARQFNICEMSVFRIQNGSTWSHVGKIIKKKQEANHLDPDIVLHIKSDLQSQTLTGVEIAKKFKVSATVISRIKNKNFN